MYAPRAHFPRRYAGQTQMHTSGRTLHFYRCTLRYRRCHWFVAHLTPQKRGRSLLPLSTVLAVFFQKPKVDAHLNEVYRQRMLRLSLAVIPRGRRLPRLWLPLLGHGPMYHTGYSTSFWVLFSSSLSHLSVRGVDRHRHRGHEHAFLLAFLCHRHELQSGCRHYVRRRHKVLSLRLFFAGSVGVKGSRKGQQTRPKRFGTITGEQRIGRFGKQGIRYGW